LPDGFLTYEVPLGGGDQLNSAVGGLNRSEVQKFDGLTVYTTSVNMEGQLC